MTYHRSLQPDIVDDYACKIQEDCKLWSPLSRYWNLALPRRKPSWNTIIISDCQCHEKIHYQRTKLKEKTLETNSYLNMPSHTRFQTYKLPFDGLWLCCTNYWCTLNCQILKRNLYYSLSIRIILNNHFYSQVIKVFLVWLYHFIYFRYWSLAILW